MNLSFRKAREPCGIITFPVLHCWNPVTRCVSIAADVEGRRILCRIPEAMIESLFGESALGAVATVAANRKIFESAAARSVGRSNPQTDATVDVLMQDFTATPP